MRNIYFFDISGLPWNCKKNSKNAEADTSGFKICFNGSHLVYAELHVIRTETGRIYLQSYMYILTFFAFPKNALI